MDKISCIYEIRNLVNNNIYIGSSNNFLVRRNKHLSQLRRNLHPNIKLQRAWNKYGEDRFQFDVLIYREQEKLRDYEQTFIDYWKPEYNIAKSANNPILRGSKRPKSFSIKISKALTGRKISDSTKEKLRNIGKTRVFSDATKKLISLKNLGIERNAKIHRGLVSPDGTVYRNIFNMAKFCREHNLHRGHILEVEKGEQSHCNGWTLLRDGDNYVGA